VRGRTVDPDLRLPPPWPYPIHRPETLALIVGAVLVLAITPVLLYLGLAHMLVLIVSATVALLFFTFPFASLLLVYAVRNVIDLLWWVDFTVFGLNPLQIFSGAVSALTGVLFFTEVRRIERTPPFVPFVFFAMLVVVAFVRSADLGASVDELVRYLSPFFLMFLVAVLHDTAEKRKALVYAIATTCTVAVCVSLYDLAAGQMETTVHHGYHRLLGGYKNLHNHALVMMFVAELFFFLALNQRNALRTFVCAGISVAAAVCMYLTYVRTAAVGLVAFLALYLVMERRYRLLATIFVGLAVFAATSAAVQDRFSDFAKFFANDPFEGGRTGLGSGRWTLWTMSLQNFLEQPWTNLVLGLGLYGYADLTSDWLSKFSPGGIRTIDPHNDYLTLLYQLGPLAVAAYLWMQWNVARTAIAIARRTKDVWERSLCHFLVGMTATVVVTNAVSNAFVQRTTLAWYYWGVAGLVFALRMAREDEWAAKMRPRPLAPVP
jgi:hypothetical protein